MDKIGTFDMTQEIPENTFRKIQASGDALWINLEKGEYKSSLLFNIPKLENKALLELKKWTSVSFKNIDFAELGEGTSYNLHKFILNAIIEIGKEEDVNGLNIMERIADRVAKLISDEISKEVLIKRSVSFEQDGDSGDTYSLGTINKNNNEILDPINIKSLNCIRV